MTSPFIHPNAICETHEVGADTRIWAFAHVLSRAVIGTDVNICDHVFVENDVVVGDRVTIKSGVQLWDGIELEDDVFVGPNVTFTNDVFPRSKQYPDVFSRITIERGASLGGGSVILPGIRVGHNAMVGAGAVVTRDIPPFAIVVGNPAHIIGYTDGSGRRMESPARQSVAKSQSASERSENLIKLNRATDIRGSLVATEFDSSFPFAPERFFVVYDVPSRDVRGEHAHRRCEQFLVCVKGAVRAIVDDGASRREFLLDSPDLGLHMPAMTWGTQYAYSPDAVLAVFASLPYDPDDYIRTYAEFKALSAVHRPGAQVEDGSSSSDAGPSAAQPAR